MKKSRITKFKKLDTSKMKKIKGGGHLIWDGEKWVEIDY